MLINPMPLLSFASKKVIVAWVLAVCGTWHLFLVNYEFFVDWNIEEYTISQELLKIETWEWCQNVPNSQVYIHVSCIYRA